MAGALKSHCWYMNRDFARGQLVSLRILTVSVGKGKFILEAVKFWELPCLHFLRFVQFKSPLSFLFLLHTLAPPPFSSVP